MPSIYAYHVHPLGFAQDLDVPGDGIYPNYTALQQGFWDMLEWFEQKCGLLPQALGRPNLVVLQSSHNLADWLNPDIGGLGASIKDDLIRFAIYDDVNLFLIFCQRMGGFAGGYIHDRIACLGDYAIDAIVGRYQAKLFAGSASERLATRDNQVGSVAHELGHLMLGAEHTDGPDGKNLMGQGIWSFPDASLTTEQIETVKIWLTV